MSRKVFALAVLALVFVPCIANAAAKKSSIDAQIAAEEKKRAELTKQVQNYRRQIKQMGAKVEGLLTKVNTLQQDESMAEQ